MKVRCIALRDSRGRPTDTSQQMTVGEVYHVLEIGIEAGRTVFRILGDERMTPALYDAELFELVSHVVPPTWKIVSNRPGRYWLRPEPWTPKEFWLELYDRQPAAVRCFDDELQKILTADP